MVVFPLRLTFSPTFCFSSKETVLGADLETSNRASIRVDSKLNRVESLLDFRALMIKMGFCSDRVLEDRVTAS